MGDRASPSQSPSQSPTTPHPPTPGLLVWFILEMQKQEKQKSRTATKANSKLMFLAFIAPATRQAGGCTPRPDEHGTSRESRAPVSARACAPFHKGRRRVSSAFARSDRGPFLRSLYNPLAKAAGG